MSASRFCRYELRTTDLDGARAFYAEVVGPEIWGADVTLAPLPEQAAARGAPPHWLGHLGVSDVDAATSRFVAQGAQPLGPTRRGAGGEARAILRDPSGAVVALTSERTPPARDLVAWHLLNTASPARASATYAELFGWTIGAEVDLGPGRGRHRSLAWDESGQSAGSVADITGSPHIHPQWLFFFRVPDLERSLARVRAAGGLALEPTTTGRGALVAPCDDPQGAAFALYEAARG